MNNYKDVVLSALRKGKTPEEIAEAFSDALNEAELVCKSEEEEKKKLTKKENQKKEAARAVIMAINDYFFLTKDEVLIEREDVSDSLLNSFCHFLDLVDCFSFTDFPF